GNRRFAEVDWLQDDDPTLRIESEVIGGVPVGAVVAESESARLTVVGTRGLGGFAGALLGSTSQGIAAHARGPVMIVPYEDDPRLEDRGPYGPMVDQDPTVEAIAQTKTSGWQANWFATPKCIYTIFNFGLQGSGELPRTPNPRRRL